MGVLRMAEYTKIEFLVACASSHVRDGENVFGGTGMPLLAALLAKETHAPKANLISEAGFIDARPRHVPLSVADSRYYFGCSAAIGLIETLGFILQAGKIDVGFLGRVTHRSEEAQLLQANLAVRSALVKSRTTARSPSRGTRRCGNCSSRRPTG